MPLPHALAALIARQDGVVSREQALAHGIPQSTVTRWVAQRAWIRLHPAVFLVEGHRRTPAVNVRAAGLWAGRGGVVSGAAAAWWHGLYDRPGPPFDVTVPLRVRRPAPLGIRVRRRDLAPADRTSSRGLALVGRPLAVLQVAVEQGSVVLDRSLQKGVTLAELRACHNRHRGVAGAQEAGRLLRAAADGAESHAERMLMTALRAAGVTGWVSGHPFGPYRIDVAFPRAQLAVEVDGWAWHSDAERFRADRRKGNALVAGDWTLLRFTWHDLDADPEDCVRQIRRALARLRPGEA